MHDIKLIRENPKYLDNGLERRSMPHQAAMVVQLDIERRVVQTQLQELLAKRNDLSKQIGDLKRSGGDVTAITEEVAKLKTLAPELEEKEKIAAQKIDELLSTLPNVPADDVPYGKDEKANLEIRKHGTPRLINSAKEHYDIGEKLGLMDFENAAKMSGARFTILKGPLAQLERALGNFMLDVHTGQFGYTEISPPLMVKDEIMFGTGQLPKFADDQFLATKAPDVFEEMQRGFELWNNFITNEVGFNEDYDPETGDIENDEKWRKIYKEKYEKQSLAKSSQNKLWLIPTAEVPLTNIVYDSIVEAEALPYRFVARTPCFRAEAGAAGRDTRGMIRQHQFYKVELVSITTPDKSNEEHERMTDAAETILKKLEIPFRTVLLCTGDMGFSARKTYDIEAWLPGQNAYREISSCSNCGDFQARRMKARFRAKGDKNTQFLHTLNGSGVAVGRALIAVLENYQQDDGSVLIPSALKPYMGGLKKISA